MTRYLPGVYQPDGEPPPPDVLEKVMRDLDVLDEELKAAGAWVFPPGCTRRARPPWCGSGTARCSSPTARSPRAKEHLGGFTIIKVPDLDSALVWGRRARPATTLPIEVRPLRDQAED